MSSGEGQYRYNGVGPNPALENAAIKNSKLKRTSQFFSRLTGFSKSHSSKSNLKSEFGIRPSRFDSGSTHPLDSNTDDHMRVDIDDISSTTAASEVHSQPDELRRDSLYSVRTSATAPAGNISCPSSPVTQKYRSSNTQPPSRAATSPPIIDDSISDDPNLAFKTQLQNFYSHHPGLTGRNSSDEMYRLNQSFGGITLNSIKASFGQPSRKNSVATNITSEASESDHESNFNLDNNQKEQASILETVVQGVTLDTFNSESAKFAKNAASPKSSMESSTRSPLLNINEITSEPIKELESENEYANTENDQSSVHDNTEETDKEAAHSIAIRCFQNDPSFLPPEQITDYLGKRKDFNGIVLEEYMDLFDFSKLTLDDAFRSLCHQLHLQGETQVIDRILNQFSKRYWACNHNPNRNPPSIFLTQDVVYAVSYSLLLLNTDLHVAKNHIKMSRNDFVKNTLSAIEATNEATEYNPANYRIKPHDLQELTSLLKDMYNRIKAHQIQQRSASLSSSSRVGTASSSSPQLHRTKSLAKIKSNASRKGPQWGDLSRQASGHSLNMSSQTYGSSPTASITYGKTTSSPAMGSPVAARPTEAPIYPYQKVGTLVRKHLYERADRKAANRAWRDCLVVVDRGDLKMYKSEKGRGMGGGDGLELMDVSLQLGNVSLRHCLSVTLPPPGYSSSRPHVFALQLPSGGVYLFQGQSSDIVAEWVILCNYWSARESKEPLPGGISSIDYGWGTSFDREEELEASNQIRSPSISDSLSISDSGRSSTTIPASSSVQLHDWKPPAPPMVRSLLSQKGQLQALLRQISTLDAELVSHMELRAVIYQRLPTKSAQYAKAFSNWERKSQYLLRELIKYQTYADVLRKAIQVNRGVHHESEEEDEEEDPDQNDPDNDLDQTISSDFAPDHSNQGNLLDDVALGSDPSLFSGTDSMHIDMESGVYSLDGFRNSFSPSVSTNPKSPLMEEETLP